MLPIQTQREEVLIFFFEKKSHTLSYAHLLTTCSARNFEEVHRSCRQTIFFFTYSFFFYSLSFEEVHGSRRLFAGRLFVRIGDVRRVLARWLLGGDN